MAGAAHGSAREPGASHDETANLRNIVASIADGIVIVARDGTVRFVNPAAEALFGRPAATLVGEPVGFALVGAEAYEIDLLRPAPDGEGLVARTAELRVVDAEWEGEAVSLVSLRDVTERNAVQEREQRLAAAEIARAEAERGAREARLLADASAALGASLDAEATLAALADAVVPHLAEWCTIDLATDDGEARAARDGRHPTLTVPLVARDVTLGVLTLGGTAARDDERTAALVSTLADRAALALLNARLYEAAQQASRAKGEFLAVMSHELRTPLNAIGGYTQLLHDGLRGPVTDQQREDLARIERNQRHLLGLINEVLNYARLENGAVTYDITPVAIAEVVRSIEPILRPQAASKGIRYVEQCDPHVVVRADRQKLEQVLLNLLTNAVKFTPRGGTVTIECSAEGPRCHVRVRDTGIGIPPEKLRTIFEPFVQVNASHTRLVEGVGLGLAISRDLARGMGGDLLAESAPDAGTTLTLTLPCAG